MIKYIEKSAKTQEQALALALEELGLERDDVTVEVLELPRSGFLGIGSSPAVLRIGYEAPDEPEEPVVEVKRSPLSLQSLKQRKNPLPAGKQKRKRLLLKRALHQRKLKER